MNFRQDYCAIMQCLEMTKTEKRDVTQKIGKRLLMQKNS